MRRTLLVSLATTLLLGGHVLTACDSGVDAERDASASQDAAGGGGPGCPAICGGECVDTRVDPAHCGGCDDPCPDGEVCSGGQCAPTCGGGTPSLCGDRCVDTDTDRLHCGGCDDPCPDGEVCSGGQCAPTCGGFTADCGGACVDTRFDPDHCGDCDEPCPDAVNATRVCAEESCSFICDQDFLDCDDQVHGCDADRLTDTDNCGECGNTCDATAACVDGTCEPGKRVFITSTTHTADLGGIAGADSLCTAIANSAGLTGTFRAWLSDSTGSPATRFTQSSSPYHLVDGTVIAADWDELTSGSLRAPIDATQTGGPPPTSDTDCSGRQAVFTHTGTDGTRAALETPCGDWTGVTTIDVHLGDRNATDVHWTASCVTTQETVCTEDQNPLYCFEQ